MWVSAHESSVDKGEKDECAVPRYEDSGAELVGASPSASMAVQKSEQVDM